MEDGTPDISVVVPVYGCAGALVELHRRLTDTLVAASASYELIFVEDRGPYDSWERLEAIARTDAHTGIYRHTRNFGQHAAITAGLAHTRGEYVVVMDCDLQDPPELIPTLWEKAQDGVDVVFAQQDEKVTSPVRRLLGHTYYRLLAFIANVHIDPRQGTFSLASRRVVDALLDFRDVDRNYVFLLTWLAFPSTVVTYRRDERHSGASSYTLGKLIAHAFSGLIFQTTVLLRYVVYLGFLFATVGLMFVLYILIARITGTRAPGWTGNLHTYHRRVRDHVDGSNRPVCRQDPRSSACETTVGSRCRAPAGHRRVADSGCSGIGVARAFA